MANEAEILGKALVMSELKRNGQIGYTKTTWETMFGAEGIKFSFEVNAEQGIGIYEANTTSVLWKAFDNGDTCKVVLDGVEYTCPAEMDETSVAIGNKEGAADGPPFLIRAYNLHTETPTLELLVMSVEPEHSLALYRQTETIHPIKPEYLPGVCLPVVDLTSVLDIEEVVTLTESESAAFADALAQNLPCVVRGNIRYIPFSRVCNVELVLETYNGFNLTYADVTIYFFANPGDETGKMWVAAPSSVL